MKLEDYGYNEKIEKTRFGLNLTDFETGRVIAEHKERYLVITNKGEFEAEITGNLRFNANGREDFPVVGDWVALTLFEPDLAVIHEILPRFSVIKRQAPGRFGEVQLIAANIDFAFIVQAADRDFNINRLERYLILCNSSGISPVILLTKTDLVSQQRLDEMISGIRARISRVKVVAVSNLTKSGYDEIAGLMVKGKTYCLLGSSGVGKSTLLNNLSGREVMKTETISGSTNRGRHTTSHRHLFVMDNGAIMIDNPGMREVGIADSSDGLETTFSLISRLSGECRFKDCSHTGETGCRVIEAVEKGEIDRASYENFMKMEKERNFFESTIAERRKKDKQFGKMLKNYQKLSPKDRT